jgi:UDP-glucose 4-epimerase
VIVLGARGFLGAELVLRLKRVAEEVVPLTSDDIDLANEASVDQLVRLLTGDDIVIMASMITPGRGGNEEKGLLRNVLMARSVAAAVGVVGCRQFIYISSDAVLGHDQEAKGAHEARCNPYDLYGLAHFLREKLLGEVVGDKAPVLVIRPCAIYGAGDTHNSYGPNRFIRSALEDGTIALIGNGEELREHIFIEDFCRYVMQGIQDTTEGVALLSTGSSVSFSDIAQKLIDIVDRPVLVKTTERVRPIVHRCFDRTPGFSFTPMHIGLRAIYEQLRQSTK